MANPPRVWLSNESPAKGELVRIRAQISHIMENGLRLDSKGAPIPRDTLTRFEARLGDDLILEWLPETAVSENPYLEFTFRAQKSGQLTLIWEDETGVIGEDSREITLS